ncbi:MAG: PmoA family protein [Verrucomicrobiales bacterium]
MKILHAALLALCLVPASLSFGAGEKLAATQVGSRIDITLGGKFFTSYRFAADEKYPFFFPVNGPSGASVTSMRNAEFPHHSSLFFGCDKVNGGNYWQETLDRGRIASRGPVLETAAGDQIVIRDTCDWTRPDAPQPIRDTRHIVITAPSPTLRQIDFDITLEALMDVVIEKTNHSLFSARMDPDLPPVFGGTMINAEGAKGEKETFGKPSPWLACFGSRVEKTTEGLAILQHPKNHGYPAPWFTRDYGFLSPTPMYWPANGKATRIAKGDKLHLS